MTFLRSGSTVRHLLGALLFGMVSAPFTTHALPPEVAGQGKFVLINLNGFTLQDGHDITLNSGVQTIGPSTHYNFEVSGTLHGTGAIGSLFPAGTDFAAAVDSIDPGRGSALHGAIFQVFSDSYPILNATVNGDAGPIHVAGTLSSDVNAGHAEFSVTNFVVTYFGVHDTTDTLVLDDARLLGVSADINRGDFGDGATHALDASADLVLTDKKHKVSIAFLNSLAYLNKSAKKSIFSALGGTKLPAGFSLVGVGDFDLSGTPDLLLFNKGTGQTEAILMNKAGFQNGDLASSIVTGPTLPAGFVPGAVGDFNSDSAFDLAIYNPKTLETKFILLRKGMGLFGADLAGSTLDGPGLPAGFQVAGAADYNDDGKVDLLLYNPKKRTTMAFFLDGATEIGSKAGPTLPKNYAFVGTSGFDNNRSLDLAIFNKVNHQVKFYLLDGENFTVTKLAKGPLIPDGFDVMAAR